MNQQCLDRYGARMDFPFLALTLSKSHKPGRGVQAINPYVVRSQKGLDSCVSFLRSGAAFLRGREGFFWSGQ
jgi:hypothetical protein